MEKMVVTPEVVRELPGACRNPPEKEVEERVKSTAFAVGTRSATRWEAPTSYSKRPACAAEAVHRPDHLGRRHEESMTADPRNWTVRMASATASIGILYESRISTSVPSGRAKGRTVAGCVRWVRDAVIDSCMTFAQIVGS